MFSYHNLSVSPYCHPGSTPCKNKNGVLAVPNGEPLPMQGLVPLFCEKVFHVEVMYTHNSARRKTIDNSEDE